MSKKTLYLLLIILAILAGTYFYIHCCSSCGTDVGDNTDSKEKIIETPVAPEATSYPFSLKDGDYSYNSQDNINFNVSNFAILDTVSPKVDAGIFSLKNHLNTNPNKSIDITGFYKSNEVNNSAFPNLGIARATAIKNYFTSKGIPSAQINVFGALKEDMVSKDNIFFGPESYAISETVEEDLGALYDKIKANPIVLHFNTGQTAVNLTAEQRQEIADISKYLDKVAGASCNVIGHTDNVGDRNNNIALGQDRANFGKGYLVSNGIPAAKINATSKGPDEPIATNATEEGKAKNRRTIITLN